MLKSPVQMFSLARSLSTNSYQKINSHKTIITKNAASVPHFAWSLKSCGLGAVFFATSLAGRPLTAQSPRQDPGNDDTPISEK